MKRAASESRDDPILGRIKRSQLSTSFAFCGSVEEPWLSKAAGLQAFLAVILHLSLLGEDGAACLGEDIAGRSHHVHVQNRGMAGPVTEMTLVEREACCTFRLQEWGAGHARKQGEQEANVGNCAISGGGSRRARRAGLGLAGMSSFSGSGTAGGWPCCEGAVPVVVGASGLVALGMMEAT